MLHRHLHQLQRYSTPTYNEFDSTKKCKIKLDYLFRATKASFKSNTHTFDVNVSSSPQKIKRALIQTQISKGKFAEVSSLKVSTDNSSAVSVNLISTELVYSDNCIVYFVNLKFLLSM